MIKSIARVSNIRDEVNIKAVKPNLAYTDNEAMMNFVKGQDVGFAGTQLSSSIYGSVVFDLTLLNEVMKSDNILRSISVQLN